MITPTETRLFQSTPSPRRETSCSAFFCAAGSDFNPLPPQGGRLRDRGMFLSHPLISIHSLPKEGDIILKAICQVFTDFNPLPPQGGRHICVTGRGGGAQFQSTPSPRRETECQHEKDGRGNISIHSLPKEGDVFSF